MINKRFLTYLSIGVIDTSIDIILLSILLYVFGNTSIYILFLNPVSYSIAIISGFLLHGRFTFKDNDLTVRKFSKFYVSSIIGLILNTSIVYLLVTNVGIGLVLSKITSACIVVSYNYTMCRRFIYEGNVNSTKI